MSVSTFRSSIPLETAAAAAARDSDICLWAATDRLRKRCVVTMSSWFAPTKLVITFETKGIGKLSEEELRKVVQKDSKGNVFLDLATKSVLITNHQVKSDSSIHPIL